MTEWQAWGLAYLLAWTMIGHWYVLRRLRAWRRHRRRSIAAQRAAVSRRRAAALKPQTPRRRKPRPKLDDRVVETDSAWFMTEEEAPDYNEVDLLAEWRPKVRRFDGAAGEYAARDSRDGSV